MRKWISLLLALTLCLASALPAHAAETHFLDDGGQRLSPSVDWKVESGVLIISGSGHMPNYTQQAPAPWHDAAFTQVVLAAGITTVGDYAFYRRSASPLSVGDQDTAAGANPVSVTLPAGVLSIGKSAFGNCTALASLTIPQSVTSVGERAFENCTALTDITLPDTLSGSAIGKAVFSGCTALSSVRLPAGLTEIPESMFQRCTALTAFYIPDTVTAIGNSAFYDCSGLSSVHIGGAVQKIGAAAFAGCAALTELPAMDGITALDANTFERCTGLTSAVIPSNVTELGANVFRGCTSLTGVTIPDSVTRIASGAFRDCTALKEVRLPAGFTGFEGSEIFAGCTSLATLPLPEGNTQVPAGMFQGCTGLTALQLPSTVTAIRKDAFSGCAGLTDLTLPAGITVLGESAFSGCTGLTTVTVPAGIRELGASVFSDCSGLTSAVLSDGIVSVPDNLFRGCWALEAVRLPDSITAIGQYAFAGCTSLTELEIPASVVKLGQGAFSGSGLNAPRLPAGLERLPTSIFSNCGNLTALTVPRGTASIGAYAFFCDSYLAAVGIPATVTRIDRSAFSGCFALRDIYFGGTEQQWKSIHLENADMGNVLLQNVTVHYGVYPVPDTAVAPAPPSPSAPPRRFSSEELYGDAAPDAPGPSDARIAEILDSFWLEWDPNSAYIGTDAADFYLFTRWDGDALELKRSSHTSYGYARDNAVFTVHNSDPTRPLFVKLRAYTLQPENTVLNVFQGSFETAARTPLDVSGSYVYKVPVESAESAYLTPILRSSGCWGQYSNNGAYSLDSNDEVIPDGTRFTIPYTHPFVQDITFSPAEGTPEDETVYSIDYLETTEDRCYAIWLEARDLETGYYIWKMYPFIFSNEKVDAHNGSSGERFVDVSAGDYFAKAVAWAVENNITQGTWVDTFSPTQAVTRGQAVTFLWRAANCPAPQNRTHTFADVPEGAWFTDAVLWAVEQGITQGTWVDSFSPAQSVTYEQLLTFLSRAAGIESSGADWAQAAMNWAAGQGLFMGLPGIPVRTEPCPRSDVVFFLWREYAQ